MPNLEYAAYLRRPRLSAENLLALAIRLLQSAPKDQLQEPALGSLKDLHEAAETFQATLRARHTAASGSLRPYDRRFDGAWAALYARLHAWTRLLDHANAPRAQALLERLFPEGLGFLRHSYDEEWVHSRTLLGLIEREGLDAELAQLAGVEFLPLIRVAHEELGKRLGLEEDDEEADDDDDDEAVNAAMFGAHLRALAQAIATYGRRMVGLVDEEDPDSIAMFEAAMAPRTAALAAAGRRSGSGEAAPDPAAQLEQVDLEAPLPPVEVSEG